MLARITRMVADAQAKAPIQRLVDRVSAVPVVIAIAAVSAIGWLADRRRRETAVINAVAVLVIRLPLRPRFWRRRRRSWSEPVSARNTAFSFAMWRPGMAGRITVVAFDRPAR